MANVIIYGIVVASLRVQREDRYDKLMRYWRLTIIMLFFKSRQDYSCLIDETQTSPPRKALFPTKPNFVYIHMQESEDR